MISSKNNPDIIDNVVKKIVLDSQSPEKINMDDLITIQDRIIYSV
jgi:hypothetical protein